MSPALSDSPSVTPPPPRGSGRPPILVYFGHVPQEGAGSAIIVARHLRRFAAAGWEIRVVADWGQDHRECTAAGWPVQELSHRRFAWPQFKPDRPLSRRLRAWLWAGEVRAGVGAGPVRGVLTYLSAFSDTLSIAAVGFARRYHLPLATLVHDDPRCFANSDAAALRVHLRHRWILAHSTRAWFASPELAACYALPAPQAGVLPPIAEGHANGPTAGSALPPDTGPRIFYAGNYWPAQLALLARIGATAAAAGGELVCITKENTADGAYLHAHGIAWLPPFPRNTDALAFLRRHASALVVSYADTTAEMPWTRSSFPSKLIEYCHLGLPIVIVAAADTAVARWAQARGFDDCFAPADRSGLLDYISRLSEPAFRRERANRVLALARGEFDSAAIHRRLAGTFPEAVL